MGFGKRNIAIGLQFPIVCVTFLSFVYILIYLRMKAEPFWLSSVTPEKSLTAVTTKDVNEYPILLSLTPKGRMGNMMCQYAALMGIASRNGFTPVISTAHEIRTILRTFKMSKKPSSLDEKLVDKLEVFMQNGTYDKRTEYLRKYMQEKVGHLGNMRLMGYFQAGDRYFSHIQDFIRSEFIPLYEHQNKVEAYMSAIMKEYPSAVRVGIHVRRGDLVTDRKFRSHIMPASYYTKSIDYYLDKFGASVLFFLACENMEWAKTHIPSQNGTRIFYSPFSDYSLDFTLLLNCDHMILSMGTFSWWAGWLTPGIKITPRLLPGNNTNWIRLTPKAVNLTNWF